MAQEYREERLYWIVAVYGESDYSIFTSPSAARYALENGNKGLPQSLLAGVIEFTNLTGIRKDDPSFWSPGVYGLNAIDMDRLREMADRE